ncbi:hypothetical protein HTY52_18935 [Cupriavidus taiwanensis]|uniref:hypothetical protein n=1 Tax=Cupriavidus taiwanensis TaxID=164546 RepID=UPI001573B197|nr:hypothetical protein [Cupriavidus taiwanensis]NSX16164.1 hypothetical protein [Cupriavidus taiwanensis]
MPYAFSGIIVRYRHPDDQTCHCQAASPQASNLDSVADGTGLARSGDEAPKNDAPTATVPTDSDRGAHQTDGLQDELHVNLWEIGKECFMDIGVMISDRNSVGAIQIDLPWKLQLSNVSDLGARLNGEKSIAAIFNEVVHYDGFADGNFANIRFRREDNLEFGAFTLLRLNSRFYEVRSMFLSDGSEASQLIIRLPKPNVEQNHNRAYVRLRIQKVPKEVYTSLFRQKDRSLLSSSTETRIIDFRINVRRGVPDELLSGDEGVFFPRFAKIHCFLTTERGDECVFQSKNFNGCRSLVDEDVWNEYIKRDSRDGISPQTSVRNYLGYQWTASYKAGSASTTSAPPGVKDLVVLGRFSKTTSGLLYIIRFLILGLLFGVSGNALWGILEPSAGKNMFGRLASLSGEDFSKLCAIAILLLIAFFIVAVTRENLSRFFQAPKALLKYFRSY